MSAFAPLKVIPFGETAYKQSRHIMLDIESLGLRYGAIVFSVGACRFNPFNGSIGPTFKMNIDIEDSKLYGLKIGHETWDWWAQQPRSLWDELTTEPVPLKSFCMSFMDWCSQHGKEPYMWGNGDSFDNVLLQGLFDAVQLPFPSHFRHWRDVRTLIAIAVSKGIGNVKVDKPEEFVEHDPLDDAKWQAIYTSRCWQYLMKR